MKAVLEFNLDLSEDRAAHKRAVNATSMYSAIYEFDKYLRDKLKYEEIPESLYPELSAIRGRLHAEMKQRSVSLEDLE
jgi:hypothetical protein